MRLRNCLGMIWSVSTAARSMQATRPVWVVKAFMGEGSGFGVRSSGVIMNDECGIMKGRGGEGSLGEGWFCRETAAAKGSPILFPPGQRTEVPMAYLIVDLASQGLPGLLSGKLASNGQYFGVNEAVGGDGFAGVDGGGALPIGELATGFFDDGLDGGGVPDVHDWIDHQFGPAGGDEQ